jgi:hypothetical protein
MNTNLIQHPITEQSVTTEGINEDYAWYQAKVLADSLDAVKFNLRRVITVLEARRADNLHVIDELLRENKNLKEKLKEKGE